MTAKPAFGECMTDPNLNRQQKTTKQVAWATFSFCVVSVLLGSKGLVGWANKLNEGALKQLATPIVLMLDRLASPVGLTQLRGDIIAVIHDEKPPIIEKTPPAIVTENMATENTAPKEDPLQNTTEISTQVAKTIVATSDFANQSVPTNTPLTALAPLAGKPLTVVLAGDSMMGVGLAFALKNAHKDDPITFIKAYKPATGLVRPEVFDWQSQYPLMTDGVTADLVIVAIGANDAQDIMLDGQLLKYGTQAWFLMYEQRMKDYLALMGDSPVVWIGLPPMRLGKYQQKMALMNRFTYAVSQTYPNVLWYNPNQDIATSGDYQEYGSPFGKTVRLRASDGIHLSNEGAAAIARGVFAFYNQNDETKQ